MLQKLFATRPKIQATSRVNFLLPKFCIVLYHPYKILRTKNFVQLMVLNVGLCSRQFLLNFWLCTMSILIRYSKGLIKFKRKLSLFITKIGKMCIAYQSWLIFPTDFKWKSPGSKYGGSIGNGPRIKHATVSQGIRHE